MRAAIYKNRPRNKLNLKKANFYQNYTLSIFSMFAGRINTSGGPHAACGLLVLDPALRVGLILPWFNTLDLFSILQLFTEWNLKKTFNFCWEEVLNSSQLWKSFLSNNEFSTEKRYFWGDTFFSTFPTSKELLMNKKVSSFFFFHFISIWKRKRNIFSSIKFKGFRKVKILCLEHSKRFGRQSCKINLVPWEKFAAI